MSIGVDETWLPISEGMAWGRVLRDGFVIGRIKRLQIIGEGDVTREWFTTEHMIQGQYTPVEGTHPTFEEALERVIFYGVED